MHHADLTRCFRQFGVRRHLPAVAHDAPVSGGLHHLFHLHGVAIPEFALLEHASLRCIRRARPLPAAFGGVVVPDVEHDGLRFQRLPLHALLGALREKRQHRRHRKNTCQEKTLHISRVAKTQIMRRPCSPAAGTAPSLA